MLYKKGKISPQWWDYTSLEDELLDEINTLSFEGVLGLSRNGFKVKIYENLHELYTAQALEYLTSWKKSTSTNPTGICGPIGPTEQLPIVAQMVNELQIDIRDGHFWAMDEWLDENDNPVGVDHPLSFAKANYDMCFNKIDPRLRMPKEHMHFPVGDLEAYTRSYDQAKCLVMQGGQGDIKHWAFNDPLKREGQYVDNPPSVEEYKALKTRKVDLHPVTLMQNARTSSGGKVALIPDRAVSVGPYETWKSEKVSIWHGGVHDSPFGIKMTAFMISKKILDSRVPMSLLGDHDNVQFNIVRHALREAETGMH
jgi:glucosamine-6-phosphate deaminase